MTKIDQSILGNLLRNHGHRADEVGACFAVAGRTVVVEHITRPGLDKGVHVYLYTNLVLDPEDAAHSYDYDNYP